MNTACPFCSPNAEDACFAETENFRAIYNIAPILPGHMLIIPRKHIKSFLALEDNTMLELIQFSRKIINTLGLIYKTNSYDWTIQEGTAAGQTIEHFHIHIIPRKINDLPKPGDWYPELVNKEKDILDSLERPRLSPEEMARNILKLKDTFLKL